MWAEVPLTRWLPPGGGRVVLVEAAQMLGNFDVRLRQYAAGKLIKAGVHLKKGMVKQMFPQHVVLQVSCPAPDAACPNTDGPTVTSNEPNEIICILSGNQRPTAELVIRGIRNTG